MLRIMVYRLLDSTICTIESDLVQSVSVMYGGKHWENLAYHKGPLLEHDETGGLQDLVSDAIQSAERRGAERGGWSTLV